MPDENSFAVICKNVKKSYGKGSAKVEALRGVNLEVKTGELLLLMGPSGSGKTTLISIIAGILTEDEGECLLFSQNINHLPDTEKTLYRGHHIGFVFQSFNLIPTLTSKENISIPLLLNHVEREKALQQSGELLAQVGIAEKSESYPEELSGGQQQRIAIARAIIHNPKLIVCDEPTSYLDYETGKKIMELLRSIVTPQKKTLIVVSHDPRIIPFADRIVYLEDGRIVSKSVEN